MFQDLPHPHPSSSEDDVLFPAIQMQDDPPVVPLAVPKDVPSTSSTTVGAQNNFMLPLETEDIDEDAFQSRPAFAAPSRPALSLKPAGLVISLPPAASASSSSSSSAAAATAVAPRPAPAVAPSNAVVAPRSVPDAEDNTAMASLPPPPPSKRKSSESGSQSESRFLILSVSFFLS